MSVTTPVRLSACVIATDEEQRLPACLQSLGFCDEVVVVDGGSSDATVELARAAGARVVENPWPGFAAQRNVALDAAAGEWVLEIDADERVSPGLADEIAALVASPPAGVTMAALPMRDLFLGRALGPSARYPRYRHRLFRRGHFRHDESRSVHEGLWPDGPTAALAGDLEHRLASSWAEALRDARAYAQLESAQRGRPSGRDAVVGLLVRPPAKLAYRLFLYGGWRDGWQGLAKVSLECSADALATAYRLRSTSQGGGGFGQEPPRLGPVRIAAVAFGAARTQRARAWLEDAQRAGADPILLTDRPAAGAVRERRLRARPGALVRGLDAEDQVRPLDALLLAGRRERLLAKFAPTALRGAVPPLALQGDAAGTVAAVQRGTRPALPT